MMSEKRQMKLFATACATLIAGTASAGVTCEGPKIKVTEQGGMALVTWRDTTQATDCRKFSTGHPDYIDVGKKLLCVIEFNDENVGAWILAPTSILFVAASVQDYPTTKNQFDPVPLALEATCTGFENE